MSGLLFTLTVADRVFLGLLALMAALVVYGVRAIRHEIRMASRLDARSVRLRTTGEQRTQWRLANPSRELLDLLDDIDALWALTDLDDAESRRGHREAVRLSWMSRHVPVRTILVGGLLLAGVLSATLMVIAQGPYNPVP